MVFYAVKQGIKSGIYKTWNECKVNVLGVKGSVYKKFNTLEEAEKFMENKQNLTTYDNVFYTDGSVNKVNSSVGGAAIDINNGIAYYGCIDDGKDNDEGELIGIFIALSKSKGSIKIYTDSTYCINVLQNGYSIYKNIDLIDSINILKKDREVYLQYVAAHNGDYYNDIADTYAKKACTIKASEGIKKEILNITTTDRTN